MGYLKAIVCMVKGHIPIKCFEDKDHNVILFENATDEDLEVLLKGNTKNGKMVLVPAFCCQRCELLIEPNVQKPISNYKNEP